MSRTFILRTGIYSLKSIRLLDKIIDTLKFGLFENEIDEMSKEARFVTLIITQFVLPEDESLPEALYGKMKLGDEYKSWKPSQNFLIDITGEALIETWASEFTKDDIANVIAVWLKTAANADGKDDRKRASLLEKALRAGTLETAEQYEAVGKPMNPFMQCRMNELINTDVVGMHLNVNDMYETIGNVAENIEKLMRENDI